MRSTLAFLCLALLPAWGCGGGSATDTGNPNPGQIYQSETLLGVICAKLNDCYGTLSIAQCEAGVLPTSQIDTELGLAPAFGTYQQIIDAEKAGTIVPGSTAAVQCGAEIAGLACSDAAVVSAYSPGSPSDFTQVYFLPASAPASCGIVFQ